MDKLFWENFIGGMMREVLKRCHSDDISEIRVRINKPLHIKMRGKEYFIKRDGSMTNACFELSEKAYKPSQDDINKSLELMSDYSLYAFEDEIKNGYITLRGGHRVGLCGQAVLDSSGGVRSLKNINGFNIRITSEIKCCAEKVIDCVAKPEIKHTLIVSPPGCGKTTLLRDIARILSNGEKSRGIRGYNVAIADERSEIAGCYLGIPGNDVGIRTDVLDACPKAVGMTMLLRSMSPEVIVADEIGGKNDITAISEIINSGVKLICTAHGASIDELLKRDNLTCLLNKKIFGLYIVLRNGNTPGEIAGIFDGDFKKWMYF